MELQEFSVLPLCLWFSDFVWDGSQATTTWTDPDNWTNGAGSPMAMTTPQRLMGQVHKMPIFLLPS